MLIELHVKTTYLTLSENTPNGFWTKERVIKESKKYKTYSEFLKNSKGASQAANRGGYLTELVWLEKQYTPKGYWTEEKLLEESKNYSSKKATKDDWLSSARAFFHPGPVKLPMFSF